MHRAGAGLTLGLLCATQCSVGRLGLDGRGVECWGFIDFEEEEASERAVGAHGQDVLGRVGFVTFDITIVERAVLEGLDASGNIAVDFVEEEEQQQTIEHDVGARGQGAIGRVGFVTFGYYRWIGTA
jgi:hypothetical protein